MRKTHLVTMEMSAQPQDATYTETPVGVLRPGKTSLPEEHVLLHCVKLMASVVASRQSPMEDCTVPKLAKLVVVEYFMHQLKRNLIILYADVLP
jgi:hypothetical protein